MYSNIVTLFLLLEQNIVVAYTFLELYFYVIFISFSVLIGKNEVIKISDFGTSRQWSEHSTKMSFAGKSIVFFFFLRGGDSETSKYL